jgi:hypothetical protein
MRLMNRRYLLSAHTTLSLGEGWVEGGGEKMSKTVVVQIQRVENRVARVVNKRVYDDSRIEIGSSAAARGD